MTTETTTGKDGWAMSWVPGSDAYNWKAQKDSIVSQLTAKTIADMKSESKTGSTGFGSMNKEELKVVQTALANLDQGQTMEAALIQIKIITDIINKAQLRAIRERRENYSDYGRTRKGTSYPELEFTPIDTAGRVYKRETTVSDDIVRENYKKFKESQK